MFHVVAWSSAVCPRVETNLTQVIDFGLLELDLLIFSLETYRLQNLQIVVQMQEKYIFLVYTPWKLTWNTMMKVWKMIFLL